MRCGADAPSSLAAGRRTAGSAASSRPFWSRRWSPAAPSGSSRGRPPRSIPTAATSGSTNTRRANRPLQPLRGRNRERGGALHPKWAHGGRAALCGLLRIGRIGCARYDSLGPRGRAPIPAFTESFYSLASHDAAAAVVAALGAQAWAYHVDEPVLRRKYFDSLSAALGVAPADSSDLTGKTMLRRAGLAPSFIKRGG